MTEDVRPGAEPPRPANDPESLEETYARLSPYGSRAGATTQQHHPVDSTSQRKSRPRARRRPGMVLALVAGGVAIVTVASIAIYGLFSFAGGLAGGDPASSPFTAPTAVSGGSVQDKWTSYPGSAFEDSSVVLANPSKEKIVAESEAFLDEFRTTLTSTYGIAWTSSWDGLVEQGSNGYGGDSILYDFYSPEWEGTVVLDDPDAREGVRALLEKMVKEHGATDLLWSNEIYSDDPEASKKQFGAKKVAGQALWTFYANDAIAQGMSVSSRVLDENLPVDDAFSGRSWFSSDSLAPGTLHVKIQLSKYGLLAEADRSAFVEKLSDYDENAKPEPR